MYLSLNWLKEFTKIPSDLSPQDLGDLITLKTAEVEGVYDEASAFENMVVGKVISLKKHPDADKLQVAMVDLGEKEEKQIVCGGVNLKEGMLVAVTKPGAKVRWHGEGDLIELKKSKIRGVESYGMIAAAEEIGLSDPDAGPKDIMDLSKYQAEAGQNLADLFNKNDVLIEIDNKSLTHRPDLWGHYGFAREVAAILDQELNKFETSVEIPNSGESPEVEISDKAYCSRYCGLKIENVKVAESPDWLKNRLKALGHSSHNNIVDITNYVMCELGQPMHAFDSSKVTGKISVRAAVDGEKIMALDDQEYELDQTNILIADEKGALALAGVIGGKDSAISKDTTSIILEAATFNASITRRTSTKLGVRTDSVQRFEKSLDPHLPPTAIKRAAELILKVCPDAKISGPITDQKEFKEESLFALLSIEKTVSKIGVEVEKSQIIEILEKLSFEVTDLGDKLKVEIPSFRATKDVDIEDDLIEEVARMYGYDQIPAILPKLPTKLPIVHEERKAKHQLRELLSYGLGFHEVYNYSFYSKERLKQNQIPEEKHLQILNYLSEEQTHMRVSLIPNLLESIQKNIKNFPTQKLYEIGRTYIDLGELFPLEEKKVALAYLSSEKEPVFYELKGILEEIFKKFEVAKIKSAPEIENAPYAHPKQALTYIDKKGNVLAKLFNLHPVVAKNIDLQNKNLALVEINFNQLVATQKKETKYQEINKFPALDIDVSVVIDRKTLIGDIQKEIKKADQNLIKEIKLFDLYEGDKIEEDKKAVAFKIKLQAEDRTLTDEEMSTIQKTIFDNLANIGGVVRGA